MAENMDWPLRANDWCRIIWLINNKQENDRCKQIIPVMNV